FQRRLRQIRKHRAVAAIESRTGPGFESPSLTAKTCTGPGVRRRILPVHLEKSRPFRSGSRRRARSAVRRTAGAVRSSAGGAPHRRIRAAAGSRSEIRLGYGVLYELLSLSSGKKTLGNGGMGFFSARFTGACRAGRQNLFWAQSP